ncbi:MAG: hypothetical protein V7637_4452 [Mycobacteriales bacterium]
MRAQRFTVTVRAGGRGRAVVPVPFDPDQVWRPKPCHHVGGTINGVRVRGTIEADPEGWSLRVGPAWLRDCRVAVGDTVAVVVEPEGPQREDLADDVAAALDANPQAGTFFDALAQFYRRAYLRWIDGASRRPELRAARIAEMVELLAAGVKQRPKPPG